MLKAEYRDTSSDYLSVSSEPDAIGSDVCGSSSALLRQVLVALAPFTAPPPTSPWQCSDIRASSGELALVPILIHTLTFIMLREGRKGGRTYVWMDGWTDELKDGLSEGRKDGRVDKRSDEMMDGQKEQTKERNDG